MSKRIAVVCDCCGRAIGVGQDVKVIRTLGREKGGAVWVEGKDICGTCWGRGCDLDTGHVSLPPGTRHPRAWTSPLYVPAAPR